MRVDEQRRARFVHRLGVSAQMDLADLLERKAGEIGLTDRARDWWRRRRHC